jgi:hypothetical protein
MNPVLVIDSNYIAPIIKLLRREIWKPIKDCPGYEVSNQGRVRSYWKVVGQGYGKGTASFITDIPQKILKDSITEDGYLYVRLKGKHCPIHRLVLETFVGPCPENCECRHLDSNRSNPDLTNLSWGTRKENAIDRKSNGTEIFVNGEKHPNAKLTDEQVVEIKVSLDKGFGLSELGREYGVTPQAIWCIKNNRTRKNI